jgi:hypothetical protein
MKRALRQSLLALTLVASATAALALPSVQDVAAEVHAGRYAQAETMLREVLAAKPKSARAHYLYAEVLAHNRKFDDARREADEAARLDPTLAFTTPEKFRAFQHMLERQKAGGSTTADTSISPTAALPAPVTTPQPSRISTAAPTPERSSGSSGVPGWVWVLGFAGLAFGAWRWASARQAQQARMAPVGQGLGGYGPAYAQSPAAAGNMPGFGNGAPVGGYGPGYGAPAAAPGSGLRTGLAVAGGVAGGVLAGMAIDRMLHPDHPDHPSNSGSHPSGASSLSSDQGFFAGDADVAANDLASREIDLGSGGDSWGGDSGGSDGGGGDW